MESLRASYMKSVSNYVYLSMCRSMQSGTRCQAAGCHRCYLCFIEYVLTLLPQFSCPLTLDSSALRLHHGGGFIKCFAHSDLGTTILIKTYEDKINSGCVMSLELESDKRLKNQDGATESSSSSLQY